MFELQRGAQISQQEGKVLRHSCVKQDSRKENNKISPTTADVPASSSQEIVTIPLTEVDNIEEQYGFKEEMSKLLQILCYKDMQTNFLKKEGVPDSAQYT